MKENINNYTLFGFILITSIILTVIFFYYTRYRKTFSTFYYNANIVLMSYSYFLVLVMMIFFISQYKHKIPDHIVTSIHTLKNGIKDRSKISDEIAKGLDELRRGLMDLAKDHHVPQDSRHELDKQTSEINVDNKISQE